MLFASNREGRRPRLAKLLISGDSLLAAAEEASSLRKASESAEHHALFENQQLYQTVKPKRESGHQGLSEDKLSHDLSLTEDNHKATRSIDVPAAVPATRLRQMHMANRPRLLATDIILSLAWCADAGSLQR